MEGYFGNDTITDFTLIDDMIVLDPYVFSTFATVMNASEQIGDDVLITHPDGNGSVTLLGVSLTNLQESNFDFGGVGVELQSVPSNQDANHASLHERANEDVSLTLIDILPRHLNRVEPSETGQVWSKEALLQFDHMPPVGRVSIDRLLELQGDPPMRGRFDDTSFAPTDKHAGIDLGFDIESIDWRVDVLASMRVDEARLL